MNETASSNLTVNLEDLEKQTLLEFELRANEAQLRKLRPSQDRLAARGDDVDAQYHELQSRRDELLLELRKRTYSGVPRSGQPSPTIFRPGPVLSRPIAASKFPRDTGPWFGYSGTVQIGRAIESRIWNAPGTKGTIYTVNLGDTGSVFFGGDIAGLPVEGYPTNPGEYDPTRPQLWLHQWYYVVPFPPPVVDSWLTYDFDVKIQAGLTLVLGASALYSRVWVGETENFTGQLWPVTSGATVGWPLDGVPLQSNTFNATGQVHVQRSMFVGAGHTPAFLLVVYIAGVLEAGSEVIFDDFSSFIVPVSSTGVGDGLVHFLYEPQLVAQP